MIYVIFFNYLADEWKHKLSYYLKDRLAKKQAV